MRAWAWSVKGWWSMKVKLQVLYNSYEQDRSKSWNTKEGYWLKPLKFTVALVLWRESFQLEHIFSVVSGSLSVLLDSLLCAMGPLLCLTQVLLSMSLVYNFFFHDLFIQLEHKQLLKFNVHRQNFHISGCSGTEWGWWCHTENCSWQCCLYYARPLSLYNL